MKQTLLRAALICCAFGAIGVSCEKDEALFDGAAPVGINANVPKSAIGGESVTTDLSAPANTGLPGLFETTREGLKQKFLRSLATNAVTPSECGPTKLRSAIRPYVMEFGDLEWEWYGTLADINFYHTLTDDSEQHFGAQGQLTNFAAKHKRNLESFWNMPNEVALTGQHTSTLQNRQAIYNVLIFWYGLSPAIANYYADFIVEQVVGPSEAFDTTPLLALDGFAISHRLTGDRIVIGDGIVQVLVDTGVDEKVVFAGILGHEWAHQIQFNNFPEWYGSEWNEAPASPESTRLTELEADFFTGYYLTHKRGGTYNWKRVEQFFELFYTIGDCSFTSNGHHGTPLQRMAASYAGYLVAQETFPKGHILSADEIHALFLESLDDILANNVGL